MKPCLTLCSSCKHYEIVGKKVKCNKNYFLLPLSEAMISVPLDYECVDYDQKEADYEKSKK